MTPPSVHSSTFRGVNTNHCKLYVPIGTKENYAFAKGWMNFQNIIEEGGDSDKDYLTIKKKDGTTLLIPMDDIEDISPVLEKIVEVHDTIYLYEDTYTDIKTETGEVMKFYIREGVVYITNAPMGSAIQSFTADGMLVKSLTVEDIVTEISLPRNSIYIIKAGGKTIKVKM